MAETLTKAEIRRKQRKDKHAKFTDEKQSEIDFLKSQVLDFKKRENSLFWQERVDNEKLRIENKELKSDLILERTHNKKLKQHIETLKSVINGKENT